MKILEPWSDMDVKNKSISYFMNACSEMDDLDRLSGLSGLHKRSA